MCQGLLPCPRHGRGKQAPRAADKQLTEPGLALAKPGTTCTQVEAQIPSSFPSAQETCPDTWEPDFAQKPSRAARCSWEQGRGRQEREGGYLPTNTDRASHGREAPRGEDPVPQAPFCQGKACSDPMAIWQRDFGGHLEPRGAGRGAKSIPAVLVLFWSD